MSEHKMKSYRLVRTNLNSQVYIILKEMIADQRFNPGGYINVEKLTQELNVSRTPIWEAIRRLEQEGLVVHTPHKGVRVRELTQETALELYAVREMLEGPAARLAAERITSGALNKMRKCLAEQRSIIKNGDPVAYSRSDHLFHLLVYEASGNKLLKELLEGLRYKALPLAFHLSPYFEEFLGFHKKVFQALRQRNGRAAEKAMQHHNQRMLEIIWSVPWGDETRRASNKDLE